MSAAFLAVPGMVDLVNSVGAAGCTVVGLTGRRDPQRDATIGNLDKVGYDYFTDANYYTKWASGAEPPAYFDGGRRQVPGSPRADRRGRSRRRAR